MTPERWRRVEELYHAALTRDESNRAAFLASACAGDAEMLRQVQSLLAHHVSNGGVLDGQAMAAAAQLISGVGESQITGRRLGVYEVQERIGAGGMGEVYRARDTRLGRDVAIKILPSIFTSDPARLARFEREARVLALLNHPHIGAIYGLEDADGVRALVLELVDGDTLADRIARGRIPLPEILTIARQIAEALEAAHDKGIVHRDLKPENIKITPDGVVKVLDFGLAKAVFGDAATADLSQAPTMTVGGTKEGLILGTAAYMSPEQASGRTADKRADVWAFGVILYEMLTRRRAFEGETASVVLAKVIEREPDWTMLPASTPPRLRELVRRCVRKDPKARLQAIGDARIQIDELISGATDEAGAVVTQPRPQRSARLAWSVAALSLVVAAALAIPATWYFRRGAPEPLLTRFEVPTPPTSNPASFALSSDGRLLAFVATVDGAPRMWVRPLDQVRAQPLAGTEGASYPFWAPDGRAIGFFADGKLKRIDLGSGGVQELANAAAGRGGTWNSDDVIVFAPTADGVLMRVMAAGGTPVAVTHIAPGVNASHRFPQFLPDGRHFLFLQPFSQSGTQGVYVGTLDDIREATRVLAATTAAVYATPGNLLWVHQGVLVAQRFDLSRMALRDEPIPIVQDAGVDGAVYRGLFAVSATGVLAHRAGRGDWRQLAWVDRAGVTQRTVGPPDENALNSPELAPDDKRVAVSRTEQGNTDVWLIDTSGDRASRLTFKSSLEGLPLWSPDGLRVVFGSFFNASSGVLLHKAASGAGDEKPLPALGEFQKPFAWSPDGHLLYGIRHPKTGADIWALPLAGDPTPVPFLRTLADETAGQFSPDGRWVAYQSNEAKSAQIYVQPFPGPGGKWQVSTAGGSQPRWRRDGNELFYVAADNHLMAVPIADGADPSTLKAGTPVPLFRTRLASGTSISPDKPQYAVASDGRFLMNLSVEGAASPIMVVLNWDAALKK